MPASTGVAVRRTLNIDISDLYRTRGRTGIQRVVREIASRAIRAATGKSAASGAAASDSAAADSAGLPAESPYDVRVLRFDAAIDRYLVLETSASLSFLVGDGEEPAIVGHQELTGFGPADIFYDIDSAWNSPLKRPRLYPLLKAGGATIISTVYDLVPLTHAQLVHPETLANWVPFIAAVYENADLVLLDSRSAENDFLRFLPQFAGERHIPTVVTRLGADFAAPEPPTPDERVATEPFRDSDYLLFVGTIEPRKLHRLALTAMDDIHAVRPDVHLVFAGKEGWNSDATMQALREHPLFGGRIHWVNTPSDGLLDELYAGAALSLYLSHSEGFGLPVAEALSRGLITIASSTSSIYEVGEGFADYVHYATATEVAETALAYLGSAQLADRRRAQIREGFVATSWDAVFGTIDRIVANLGAADAIRALPQPAGLQWVFISNVISSLRRTIALLDERVAWAREYVIVAPDRLREEVLSIPSRRPVRFIAEEGMLGDDMEAFRAADHQRKNWMLRSSLVHLDELDAEFIMLDDDNQPLVDVPLETFIGPDRTYRGYYFYENPRWPHRATEYDFGQHVTHQVLLAAGLEMLAYSSHQPQVINKALFAEVIAWVTEVAPEASVDEWSVYFNFVASRYPTLLTKRVFRTLHWPSSPSDWQHQVSPVDYLFENFYEPLDDDPNHQPTGPTSLEHRAAVALQNRAPYVRSAELFAASGPVLTEFELAHGAMVFAAGDTQLVVSGVPHVITAGDNAPLRMSLTFARLGVGTSDDEVQLCYRILGESISYGVSVEHRAMPTGIPANGTLELPVPSEPLKPGVYDIEFFAKIDGAYVFTERVSYRSKLVVCAADESVPGVFATL
ncbi:glycosyltransferase family 1 protein [Glaciihabitans sp. dw_435]|uniref:glycosyltransferase family 4 protein n=1 Tax=Glaciihabitans sp. dw_435 TaxID=2720081 RepID=UPI001BD2D464|nr:glycosyltransferase family 1 protein [Glaciihabitans sp. dw_435]